MIPVSRILVEKSSSVSSGQNWALCSLPNPVPGSGAEGYERNVCSYVKNGGHWHDYPWHLGKEEVQRLVAGSAQCFFSDNRGVKRSLMWEFQERNLNLAQRWHICMWVRTSHESSLHTVTGPAGITGTSPGQKTHDRPLLGLHLPPHTQQVPIWKVNIPPDKVIKQGGHGAGVALKPWQSVPTNQNLSQNQCTQI